MNFGRAAPQATRLAGRTGRRMAGLPVLAVLLAMAGCDTIGNPFEAFGAGIPPPDEFQVMQYEPLVVPETYDLPEPRPGATSPRKPQPERDAVEALLGPGAVPAQAAGPSAGEQLLLGSANAAAASEDIRVQIEEERTRSAETGEYQPPTIFELLGFSSDDELEGVDEEDLVDPVAEAARLREAGAATPVDPEAEARAAEEEPAREPEIIDRRPPPRIEPQREPAF